MEYSELIKKRYSARAYKSQPVEPEKLQCVLEAAVLAPTAANRQAFKIIVIPTLGHEEELKTIYNKPWFTEAPYILGVCSIPEKAWVRSDGKNYSDVDAAIVMDHIVMAATDQDLGTCWIGAFKPQLAKEVLHLEDTLEPIAFTPLGYARETDFQKVRKAVEELVIYKE